MDAMLLQARGRRRRRRETTRERLNDSETTVLKAAPRCLRSVPIFGSTFKAFVRVDLSNFIKDQNVDSIVECKQQRVQRTQSSSVGACTRALLLRCYQRRCGGRRHCGSSSPGGGSATRHLRNVVVLSISARDARWQLSRRVERTDPVVEHRGKWRRNSGKVPSTLLPRLTLRNVALSRRHWMRARR